MAYESIAEYVDKIEDLLTEDLSPQAIASRLGIPEKWRTIHRYKKEVFDFKKAAAEEWTQEKQKGHEERFKAGKDRIIDDFEFLNRIKLKADSLLDFNAGDTYTRVNKNGEEETGIITPHSLSEIYGKAAQMGSAAIKAGQELAGDDPGSKMADAIESISDVELDQLLNALGTGEKGGTEGKS